jgi:hypothetical protein
MRRPKLVALMPEAFGKPGLSIAEASVLMEQLDRPGNSESVMGR